MPISADLYALQEVDSALDSRAAEIERITTRLAEERGAEARESVVEAEARRLAAEQAVRSIEDDVADLQAKTAPVEEKLYGGSVRNPKELQSLQEELDMFLRQRRQLEDRQLSAMEELEASGASLAAARERLRAEESAYGEEMAQLRQRLGELEADQAQLREQRASRAARIDTDRLRLYERLRTSRRGQAVAKMVRGVCQGCRITLPTTVQQRARSSAQIVQCTSCERILFAG